MQYLPTERNRSTAAALSSTETSASVEITTEAFDKLEQGMPPEDVITIASSPSKISSRATGKEWIPFYVGSDSRRTYWSYKGVGYSASSRNKYTGNKKIVVIRLDTSAP